MNALLNKLSKAPLHNTKGGNTCHRSRIQKDYNINKEKWQENGGKEKKWGDQLQTQSQPCSELEFLTTT